MKKILVSGVLAAMLVLTIAPAVLATSTSIAQTPNECCVLRHKIGGIDKGTVVLSPQGGFCDLTGDGNSDVSGTATTVTINSTSHAVQRAKNWGLYCMIDSVKTITDWIFYFLVLIVVVMVVIGGFMYVTAAGNPDKAKSATKILTFAVIGLAIALLAKLIPSITRFIVGL